MIVGILFGLLHWNFLLQVPEKRDGFEQRLFGLFVEAQDSVGEKCLSNYNSSRPKFKMDSNEREEMSQ